MAIKRSVGCNCCGCAWSAFADIESSGLEIAADTAVTLYNTFMEMHNYDFETDLFDGAGSDQSFEAEVEIIDAATSAVLDTLTWKHFSDWTLYRNSSTPLTSCSDKKKWWSGFGFERANGTKNITSVEEREVGPDTIFAKIVSATAGTTQANANIHASEVLCEVRAYPTGTVAREDIPCSNTVAGSVQCPSLSHASNTELVAEYDKWVVPESSPSLPSLNFHRLWYLDADPDQHAIDESTACGNCSPSGSYYRAVTSGDLNYSLNSGCYSSGDQTKSIASSATWFYGFGGATGALTMIMECPDVPADSTVIEVYDDVINSGNGVNNGGLMNVRMVQSEVKTTSGSSITLQILRDAADDTVDVVVSVTGLADQTVSFAAGELVKTLSVTAPTATAGSPVWNPPSIQSIGPDPVLSAMRVRGHALEFFCSGGQSLHVDHPAFVEGEWHAIDISSFSATNFKFRITASAPITYGQYAEQDSRRKDTGCFEPLHSECQIDGVCKAKPEYHIQPIELESITDDPTTPVLPPFARLEINGCESVSYYEMDRSQNILDLNLPTGGRHIDRRQNLSKFDYSGDHLFNTYYVEKQDWPTGVTSIQYDSCDQGLGQYCTAVTIDHVYPTGDYGLLPSTNPSQYFITVQGSCESCPASDDGWEGIYGAFNIPVSSEANFRQEVWDQLEADYEVATNGLLMSYYADEVDWLSPCEEIAGATETYTDAITFEAHDNEGVEKITVHAEVVKPEIKSGNVWDTAYNSAYAGDYVQSSGEFPGLLFQHVQSTTSFDYSGQVSLNQIDTVTVNPLYGTSFKDWIATGVTVWVEVSGAANPADDGYYTFANTSGTLTLTGKTATAPALTPAKVGVSAKIGVEHLTHPWIEAGYTTEAEINQAEQLVEGDPVIVGLSFTVDVVIGNGQIDNSLNKTSVGPELGGYSWYRDCSGELAYHGSRTDGEILMANFGAGAHSEAAGQSGNWGLRGCGASTMSGPYVDGNGEVYHCVDPSLGEYWDPAPPLYECGNSGTYLIDENGWLGTVAGNSKGSSWAAESHCPDPDKKLVRLPNTNGSDVIIGKQQYTVIGSFLDQTFEDVCCDFNTTTPSTIEMWWGDIDSAPALVPDLQLDGFCQTGHHILSQYRTQLSLGGLSGFELPSALLEMTTKYFRYKTKWVDCWDGMPDFTGLTFNSSDEKVDVNGNSVNEDINYVSGVTMSDDVGKAEPFDWDEGEEFSNPVLGDYFLPTIKFTINSATIDVSNFQFTLGGVSW